MAQHPISHRADISECPGGRGHQRRWQESPVFLPLTSFSFENQPGAKRLPSWLWIFGMAIACVLCVRLVTNHRDPSCLELKLASYSPTGNIDNIDIKRNKR